ncbi:abc transporter protein [Rutstroemia sp. NJR-2017a BBW]|nr:abc transporter protein [Rutstroemia sp. NJR-2017a BBW]
MKMVPDPSSAMQVFSTPHPPAKLWMVVELIRYAYPALVFFYFMVALTLTVCNLQSQAQRVKGQHIRRGVILCLIISLAGTYIAEIVIVIIKAVVDNWYPGQDRVVYLISSVLAFMVETVALSDTQFPVWYPYYGTWFIGLVVELTLLILPNVFRPATNSPFDYLFIAIQVLRIVNLILLPGTYFFLRNDSEEYDTDDTERQSLLPKKSGSKTPNSETSTVNGSGYGTTGEASAEDEEDDSDTASVASEDSYLEEQRKNKEAIAKRLQQDGSWWTYAKGFSIFLPYLWPTHNIWLQLRVLLVALTLLASNVLHAIVPIQFGRMVESLITYSQGDHNHSFWIPILVYSALRFIAGGACLNTIRKWLWLPLEQYAYHTLSAKAHAHVMSLSSDFHDAKSSSEVFQAVSGGRSVRELLDMACFQITPMFIDLAVAFVYFGAYGPYMFLVLAVTSITYLYVTAKMIAMRADHRRDLIIHTRKEWTVGQESLDGWTTASLFNMIDYEADRYSTGATPLCFQPLNAYLKSSKSYDIFSRLTSLAQGFILACGLTGVLCLGAWQVAYEGQSVGSFTTLLMFWAQLQISPSCHNDRVTGPLVFFSNAYRQISYSLMEAERLLEVLKTEPTIKDAPDARELQVTEGKIEFDAVCFAYDERKPTLKDVSFCAPGGKSIAFVGETGGGKSTLLKLMDRFYDINTGSIKIDGQDIREITMHSLRSHIGVVPQDPMMFNDTIMSNLKYARLDATDEEVFEACKAAAVHDKIMKFPDGYKSKVGDRGVKLSGGEKQRIAIARAMLKRPTIILLDEATSAVDTETEQLIQQGFQALCKGRTTFVVAHRLSTVMNADHIVVVMDGKIVEQGSHDELFHSKGKYADLWAKQIFVKPLEDDQSKSKKNAKKDTNIINDVTLQQKTVTLAEAAKEADHDHVQHDGPSTPTPENDSKSTEQAKEVRIEAESERTRVCPIAIEEQ